MMSKDPTQKNTFKMNWQEFNAWATGYVLFSIGEGKTLQKSIYVVMEHISQNKVFGGAKVRKEEQ